MTVSKGKILDLNWFFLAFILRSIHCFLLLYVYVKPGCRLFIMKRYLYVCIVKDFCLFIVEEIGFLLLIVIITNIINQEWSCQVFLFG